MKDNQYIEHNFKVLAGLRDLFRLFNENGAIIGRDTTRIAIDTRRVPSFALGDIEDLFRDYYLLGKDAFLSLFSLMEIDDKRNILLFNTTFSLQSNDPDPYPDPDFGPVGYAHFTAFNEIFELLHDIPATSIEQSEAFGLQDEARWAELTEMQREEILGYLFSDGGDESSDSLFLKNEKMLN